MRDHLGTHRRPLVLERDPAQPDVCSCDHRASPDPAAKSFCVLVALALSSVMAVGCSGNAASRTDAGDGAMPDGGAEQLPDAGDAGEARADYLVFQHFSGSGMTDPSDPDGGSIFVQPNQSYPDMVTEDETYADYVTTLVGVDPASPVSVDGHERRLGFSMGPLALDLGEQRIAQSIAAGFEAAASKNVAVVFHLDTSHFWKLVTDGDGRLSDGRGSLDVREWLDWDGTVAAAGQHPGSDAWQPNLLPQMCYECDRVKAMVDRYTAAIGMALQAGMERLASRPDLFGGIIVGWEAGSDNPLGYHSLTVKGYDASTPIATLRQAQQQILHDYLERWARPLNTTYGVPATKIYTHVSICTQWDIDNGHCNPDNANGPDAFWEMFNDYSTGGVSIYANDKAEGMFDDIEQAANDYGGGAWGMMEGTNMSILTYDATTNTYGPSDIDFETYLANIFNRGAAMADIFGVEESNVFNGDPSTTSEAVAAYRKFLTGGTLVAQP